MRFLSVCSGIEAASVAWNPLGWKAAAFSEIEPFPCAVLAHHYPDVPNRGDMTKFKDWPDEPIDLLCGGTPCQSFSVAGLRKGLDDPRGNLMLTYGAIAAKYRPKWLVWENVPGVLSSNGGRDFGSFLGLLGQLGYGFAYRVLDAQYFGVAQRRRRVFVVGCFGDWRSAAAVLFERHSLQGHPAPPRETGKAAPTIPSRSTAGGGLGTDFDCDGGLIPELSPTLISGPTSKASHGKKSGTDREVLIPVPELLCVATGQAGADMGADMAPTLNCNHEAPYIAGHVTHSLRGEGFDASEDGTGRGTPLVPVACDVYNGQVTGDVAATLGAHTGSSATHAGPTVAVPTYTLAIRGRGDSHNLEYRTDGTANALLTPNGGRGGIGVGAVAFAQNQRDEVRTMDVAGALAAEPGAKQQTYVAIPAIAFDCKASGQNGFGIGEIASTQRAMGHAGSHTNGGGRQAVAYSTKLHNTTSNQAGKLYQEYTAGLDRNSPPPALLTTMQVRRLTPRECERLQGFPDDYTLIPHRGKPAADSPRYKALGNSWAVPCARWIGERIQAVEGIHAARREAA